MPSSKLRISRAFIYIALTSLIAALSVYIFITAHAIAGPVMMPDTKSQGWHVQDMTPAEQDIFHAALAQGRPEAQEYVKALRDDIIIAAFDPSETNPCHAPTSCFKKGIFHDTIYYNRTNLQGGDYTTAVVWHELGHAIDQEYFNNDTFDDLDKLMYQRSGEYWPITSTGEQTPIIEVWAEVWTSWALHSPKYFSSYGVGPVITFSDTEYLLNTYIN